MSGAADIRIPFDPETESMYCSLDGLKLEKSAHMFDEFMLCPRHGEFTLAPVIMREPLQVMGSEPSFRLIDNPSTTAGKWFIRADSQLAGMLSNAKVIDSHHTDGSDYDPHESRVI